jgi:glycosyltransferase involved in cell wall biosynthesis
MLSVVIITLNAESHLRLCLDSVVWADEIVVLDSGSTDNTASICAEYGVRFEQTRGWPGFGRQKNRVLALAQHEWVLSLDADEMLTPALREEIEQFMRNPKGYSALSFPRLSQFCGHWIYHGAWYPDRVTRLFQASKGKFSPDIVHERLLVEGKVCAAEHPLLHFTYPDLNQALDKLRRYSQLNAEQLFQRGKRSTPAHALLRAAWAFWRSYLIKAGFLDGQAGLMLAAYMAHGTFYKYLALWLLGKKPPSGST